jgi:MFS family permease
VTRSGPAVERPIAAADGPARPRVTGRLRVFGGGFAFAALAQSLQIGASSVLLGLQAEAFGEAAKVGTLAVLTTLGAAVSMVVQPLAGLLSDRTRGRRFGRRVPWLLGGALASGACLLGVGTASTPLRLDMAWVLFNIAFNLMPGPLHALLPDRVPRPLFGTFAAVFGAASLGGGVLGAVLAAGFARRVPLAWLLIGGLLIASAVVLALCAGPDPARDPGHPPPRLRAAYWANPVRYPDFAWAFAGRFLMNLGYDCAATTYTLYILEDYVGLHAAAVTVVPLIGAASLVGLVISTVVSGPLSDRIGRRRVFVLAAGATVAAATLVPLVSPTVAGMVVFTGVSGLGFGMYQSVDLAIAAEVLPSRATFGSGFGVLNLAVAVPTTIAAAVSGGLVRLTGSYAPIFPVSAALVLLAGFSVLRIRSVR